MDAFRLKRLSHFPQQTLKLFDTVFVLGERFLESDDFLFWREIERAEVHRNFLLVRVFVVNRA